MGDVTCSGFIFAVSPVDGEEINFDQAVKQFQEFLKANQYAAQIQWVQPEDVLVTGRRLFYVRISSSSEREKSVRKVYEEGMPRRLGVLLETICELQNSTCCYAWAPSTADEAQRSLMPVGLKMSVQRDKIKGIQVKNHIWWAWLSFRYREKQVLKRLLFQSYG